MNIEKDSLVIIIGFLIASHMFAYVIGNLFSTGPSHSLQLESLVRHEIPVRIKMFKKTGNPEHLKILVVDTNVIITARGDGTGVIRVKK